MLSAVCSDEELSQCWRSCRFEFAAFASSKDPPRPEGPQESAQGAVAQRQTLGPYTPTMSAIVAHQRCAGDAPAPPRHILRFFAYPRPEGPQESAQGAVAQRQTLGPYTPTMSAIVAHQRCAGDAAVPPDTSFVFLPIPRPEGPQESAQGAVAQRQTLGPYTPTVSAIVAHQRCAGDAAVPPDTSFVFLPIPGLKGRRSQPRVQSRSDKPWVQTHPPRPQSSRAKGARETRLPPQTHPSPPLPPPPQKTRQTSRPGGCVKSNARLAPYFAFTLKFRNTTGSLCPAKPMKPFVWSRPFGGCGIWLRSS